MSTSYKLPSRIRKVIETLISDANKSDLSFKHSAAVMYGKNIISLGHNSTRTLLNGVIVPSTHAERIATSRVKFKQCKLQGLSLVCYCHKNR